MIARCLSLLAFLISSVVTSGLGWANPVPVRKTPTTVPQTRPTPLPSTPIPLSSPTTTQGGVIRIAAVGDVMMGTDRMRLRDQGRHLFAACRPFLQGFDIVFLNNEGTFAKPETPPFKKAKAGLSYVFRSPQSYVRWLVEAGFNMASLANNHSYDYGWPGLMETVRVLHKAGIRTSHNYGTIAQQVIRGTRVVMIAFHTSRYGKHNVNDIPQAQQLVRQLAQKYDIVIVSFHGGAEGLNKTRVPKQPEKFLGERRGDVFRFARGVVDAGAALVLGHGPHVPRAIEVYKGHLIAYSLGNFVTTGFGLRSYLGHAPLLQVELTTQGKLVRGRVVSFLQKPYRGVILDPDNQVARLIHTVGNQDFPTTNAVDAKGFIRPRPTP